MKLRNNFSSIIIILIITLIGYWQVSFFVYGLKYDLIDVVLPFRYYFSECLNSGYFPFWNPYQQTGTPFYADLQAPTYYPELLIVSFFGRYGIYTMHVLFVVYLFFAAIGMYKLAFFFNESRNASFIAALSYTFSGYFVGHGQHFFLLVGAAWIPFVILSYIKLNSDRKFADSIQAAIFTFLLISGAYQALTIAMFYLLLLLFMYFISKALVSRNKRISLQILKANAYFFLITIILSLPLIISTFEILSSVERLDSGVNLEKTLAIGQPITTFLSFIIPFSTLKFNEFFGNQDHSLINHYFGIILLIFLVVSLLRKHSNLEYIILGFGLIIFSMSFEFLPVRKFFYHYIPMMNLFVSAAYIRIYGVLAFILIATKYISHLEKNFSGERGRIIAVGSVMFFALVALMLYSIGKVTINDFKSLLKIHYVEDLLNALSFHQHIIIQALFQIFIVGGLLITVIFYRKLKYPIAIISILIASELFFAAQLNMHSTVITMQHKPHNMHRDLSLSPAGFPIPTNNKIVFNNEQHAFYAPFWRNTFIFSKQVSFHAFSSFKLKSYSKLDDEFLNLKEATLNNHLFYFSDKILPLADFKDSEINIDSSKYLFLSQPDYDLLSQAVVRTDTSDKIRIEEFSPNYVEVKTITANNQFLTLLQSNYKGWKAYVDANETPIYTSNFNYRTVLLPKGEHSVRYEYKNNKILVFYILSNVLFFACILFLLSRWLYLKKKRGLNYVYIPVSLFVMLVFVSVIRFSKKQTKHNVNDYYNLKFPHAKAYFYELKDYRNFKKSSDTIIPMKDINCFVLDSSIEYLPVLEIVQYNNKIKEGTIKLTAKIFTNSYCNPLIVSEINNKWHAGKVQNQIEELNQWNEIHYVRRIPKMKNGEILKVYIWNAGKSSFISDSISVELFDKDN